VLKVRFADFTTITRSRTLPERTDVARTVYLTARELYHALGLDRARIRLVGVRVEGLIDVAASHRQPTLDERRRAGGRRNGPSTGPAPGSGPVRSARPHSSPTGDRTGSGRDRPRSGG